MNIKAPQSKPRNFLLHLRRKTTMSRRDAGLRVLTGVCFWSLVLCSGVRAEPDPRITIHPPATKASAPRTTTDLLTFIRALEAPRGYDDYERRIRTPPPRPLTAMTVGEVLDWQVRLRRAGAVSTAAGGYQIIYPTLARLVSRYGISRSARFDAPLQDRLAQLLIAECGPPGPRSTHPRYGNCLARIWAALPLTHGTGAGQSAHQGLAGNTALTTPETVLALLAGEAVEIGPQGPQAGQTVTRGTGARGTGARGTHPRAFGTKTLTVDIEEINTALRKARRDNTLTPSLRSWKQDPYAQN